MPTPLSAQAAKIKPLWWPAASKILGWLPASDPNVLAQVAALSNEIPAHILSQLVSVLAVSDQSLHKAEAILNANPSLTPALIQDPYLLLELWQRLPVIKSISDELCKATRAGRVLPIGMAGAAWMAKTPTSFVNTSKNNNLKEWSAWCERFAQSPNKDKYQKAMGWEIPMPSHSYFSIPRLSGFSVVHCLRAIAWNDGAFNEEEMFHKKRNKLLIEFAQAVKDKNLFARQEQPISAFVQKHTHGLAPSSTAHPASANSSLMSELEHLDWGSIDYRATTSADRYKDLFPGLQNHPLVATQDPSLPLHAPAIVSSLLKIECYAPRALWNQDAAQGSVHMLDQLDLLGIPVVAPAQSLIEHHPLRLALRAGHKNLLQHLLARGLDPNIQDPLTHDNLWHAVGTKPGQSTINALLSIPADQLSPTANAPNTAGDYPIHVAVQSMNVDFVKHLLAAGADPNVKNAKGLLPLASVKRTGPKAQENLAAISALLEEQDPSLSPENLSQPEKDQALFAASKAQSSAMVDRLLSAGANPNAQNAQRLTPLLASLHAFSPCFTDARNDQAIKDQNKVMASLLAAGADPNAKDVSGDTPLHLATRKGLRDAVRVLLQAGSDMFQENNFGIAPPYVYVILLRGTKVGQRAVDMVYTYIQSGLDLSRTARSQKSYYNPTAGDHTATPFSSCKSDPEIAQLLAALASNQEIDQVLRQLQITPTSDPVPSARKKRM